MIFHLWCMCKTCIKCMQNIHVQLHFHDDNIFNDDRSERVYDQDMELSSWSHRRKESWAQGTQSNQDEEVKITREVKEIKRQWQSLVENKKLDQTLSASTKCSTEKASGAPDQADSSNEEEIVFVRREQCVDKRWVINEM